MKWDEHENDYLQDTLNHTNPNKEIFWQYYQHEMRDEKCNRIHTYIISCSDRK